jgi:uncharacterized SAM-binding protein YcdF (DUF218 family)
MRWGGYILVSTDPLPLHSDVAVVMQGSIAAERARLAGAVELLQENRVGQILVSIPKESYWGQSIAPIARTYIERNYGPTAAAHLTFCGTDRTVDSTRQEAAVLADCVRGSNWHSMVLVTSDYHTRRAKIIWKKVLGKNSPIERPHVYGVADEEFHPAGWWRDRRSAKTWITEITKLWWTSVVELSRST